MHPELFEYFKSKTGISEERFKKIAPFFSRQRVAKGDTLLRAGQVCLQNYFVCEGCLRFYRLSEDGAEFTRYFAFPGKFGTALTSLIDRKPSFEFMEAIEPTELLSIGRDDFYHLVNTVPEVNQIYRDILEMAYVTSQERIYGLQGDRALDRLRWFLEYKPDVFNTLSNAAIASYLGITQYTLSRLKSEL